MLSELKQRYWEASETAGIWLQVWSGRCDPVFRETVFSNHSFRGKAAVAPQSSGAGTRADAAAEWLLLAQDSSPDDGVSYGYFPLSESHGWDVSYPETTGYIMTSLLEYARARQRPELVDRVSRMAHWEAEIQMPSGAVQAGKVTSPDRQSAATFNTGMVLDGYASLLGERDDSRIAKAAQRAADFLVDDMTSDGVFTSNGPFVSGTKVKLFNVLCGWALYRFGVLSNEARYCSAGIAAVEGALRFMAPNGWLGENCLTDAERPLTHTIGYSLQGILEVGVAADRDDFVEAARRGFEPVLARIEPNGFLAGRFDANWRPAVKWSCLTGSAQLAIVGYRLSEIIGKSHFAEAADRLVNWLKPLQRLETPNPAINGALPGSFPILGGYMRAGYPNWATKYLLDALLMQERAGH